MTDQNTMYATIILSQYAGQGSAGWGDSGQEWTKDKSKAINAFHSFCKENANIRAKLISFTHEKGETGVIAEQHGNPRMLPM